MMIAGVWGGIMFSVRILARSLSLLLIGVCVCYMLQGVVIRA